MKMWIKAIGGMLGTSLLFSGVVIIAGGTMGSEDQSRLPIHRGEFCRNAMMESSGVPEEEIDRIREKVLMERGLFHRLVRCKASGCFPVAVSSQ